MGRSRGIFASRDVWLIGWRDELPQTIVRLITRRLCRRVMPAPFRINQQ